MGNPLVHVKLNTTCPKRAKEFFGQLFDWVLEDMDMSAGGTCTMIKVGDGTGGSTMKHPVAGAPSLWIPYVLVDDLAAATSRAKQLGAHIIKETEPVPDMARSRSSPTPPAPRSGCGR
jgi:hypothetical protein